MNLLASTDGQCARQDDPDGNELQTKEMFRSPENRQSRPRREEKQPSHQSPGKWRPQDGRDNSQVNRNRSAIEWASLDPSFAYDVEDRANGRSWIAVSSYHSKAGRKPGSEKFEWNFKLELVMIEIATALAGSTEGIDHVLITGFHVPCLPPRRLDEPARQVCDAAFSRTSALPKEGYSGTLDKDHIKLRGIGDLSIFSEGVTYFSCKFHIFWKPANVIGGLIGDTHRLGK
ncbi:hypothetical protein EDB83DRAFT_2312834 [Lactarius deliciosus]|nr:hypothetical protein EDB83DRAFT_2312834 [Lactarius deliciosus]